MSSITFDTHAFVKKLKESGFTEQQAEALADAQSKLIDERLATKQDIMDLQRNLKELEMRLTIRLGSIVAAGIVIVAALVKLL